MSRKFSLLLIGFFIISGIMHYLHINSTWEFIISCIAIIFVAGFLGKATESVAHYGGERIGGFLNATFGNAAELIIAIFLLKEGLFDVVKASITGSIIGNLLLVLGLSLFLGGLKFRIQKFNRMLASHNVSLMVLSVIALSIPAMYTQILGQEHTVQFSIIVAAILIAAYLLWLFFSMVTHKKEMSEEPDMIMPQKENDKPAWSLRTSLLFLLLATIMVALVSEWLVSTVDSFAQQFGLSELFIGAFLIAIIGNAAEHTAAIMMAMKNKIGAAVEIAIGSSLQIALFVAPVLVFVSLIFGNAMDLVFTMPELVAIIVAVFITKSISGDGETNWYEGFLQLAVYLILGVAFFLL